MEKNKKIIITFLAVMPLALAGCSNSEKAGREAVVKYQKEEATDYAKKADSYLSKGDIDKASVYYKLAEDNGKKGGAIQSALSQWGKAADLESAGNYQDALTNYKKIKTTSNRGFNRLLSKKIDDLTNITENTKRYAQGYQQALASYNAKNYAQAIEQLKQLLADKDIKSKEYLDVFSNIHDLLLKSTLDLANTNLATAQGTPVETQPATQETQQSQASGTQTPPKLANGKQVTQADITKARDQIDKLNVDGMKSSFFSGEDITNIINIAIKNQHNEITRTDLEEFLKPKGK
ncbi:hypothetical protein [Xylocopilactobacillus apicola]|uniref:Lipoprotein n=1 Tax=Xylocopilactobacillus apicola TaxID=2932184 RepID=A0AAU9D084_9LACO|nr:hypothetical protein [Xylocopilactobacillus apicola]BDR59669.1 hypothetical protein XA3_21100 [Xylocopilactobacillus apicola]